MILSFKKLFKKVSDLLDVIENTMDTVLYVQDETSIRMESNNHRRWSLIGQPPVIERNGARRGLNLIGATEISKNYDSFVTMYPSEKTITSVEIIDFLKELLSRNEGKKIFLIWDNAKTHTSNAVEEFCKQHSDELFLMNLPPYSPMLNPQENVWNILKRNYYSAASRKSVNEIEDFVLKFYEDANSDPDMIKRFVNSRSYYK